MEIGSGQRCGAGALGVICAAKNAASAIERTIESIFAQDFQSWRMIIVDEGLAAGAVAAAARDWSGS